VAAVTESVSYVIVAAGDTLMDRYTGGISTCK